MKIRETLPIDDVLPGMHLAEAVTDAAGRVLVPAATELSESLLQGLARRDIDELVVEREVSEDPAAIQARRVEVEALLARRFRKAGDGQATQSLYRAIFDFTVEYRA